YMKTNRFNMLRIYTGWCSSLYTGDVNNPMNAATQTFLADLLSQCGREGFLVVFSVADQVNQLYTQFPDEAQRGFNGEVCGAGGNYMCPSGPNFRTFTANLIRKYLEIAGPRLAIRWISVDEMQFVSAGSGGSFYSATMKAAFTRATGKQAVNLPTSGTWTAAQQEYADFCRNMMQDYYLEMQAVTAGADPDCRFGALIDAYWVEGAYIDRTQPYSHYQTLNNVCFEWFASQTTSLTEMQNRITTWKTKIAAGSRKYYIYGRLSAGATLMRSAIQLAKDNGFDGVFIYEWYDIYNTPFDVRDLTGEPVIPPPPPQKWACPICGALFDSEIQLAIHISTDHPPPAFTCQICGATFPTQADLDAHLLTHQMPPPAPYQCPFCDLGFNTEAELGAHITAVHPSSVYVCPSCGAQFPTVAELAAHMASVHPKPPSGCFIATACGTSNVHLATLRRFRDQCLPLELVHAYYRSSPPLANRIRPHDNVKKVFRRVIEWLTCQLKKNLSV
ncbi:C2H2-type zinc finger protein, partial [Candidatus Bathyarchaeota archaeon]|nr:C2H2-type zinc finger protein [Candidatus Bathyarchaeota archaeon]